MKHEKLKKLVALTLVIGLTLTEMPMLAKAATTNSTITTNPAKLANLTETSVSKPSEVPSNIWKYAYNVDKKFNKNGDFALLLCAVIKKESNFGAGLSGSPSSGDGLMQVEPSTRNAYAAKFKSTYGRTYNHGNLQDQVALGGLIIKEMVDQFGGVYNGLLHYNGGPNWYPGCTDSYGRPILADQYANAVYKTYKNYGGKK